MKKNFKVLLVLIMALICLVGCGKKKEEVKNVEGTLEEIMEKLYAEIPEENRPMFLENMEVNDDNIEGYIGTSNIEYKEIIASESMTGSIAHSVVLIRTKENADIDKIEKEIKENVDPNKWICVGIERDQVVIKHKGDLIVVIIIEDETNRDKIATAFDNL